MQPVHFHLCGWLERLEIDQDGAKRIALGLNDEDRELHLDTIDLINNGRVEFWICNYGRVHTLPTRLPKQLRPLLTLDGHSLVELDLANCQPLLLGLLYLSKQRSNKEGEGSLPGSPFPLSPSSHIMMGISQDRQSLPEDARAYQSLCEEGRIYDHLAMHSGGEMDRDQAKHRLFVDLFCGENHYKSQIRDLVRREFPTISTLINQEKRDEYQALGRQLQKMESDIMIGGVCERLRIEHPHIPLLTIHDCIVTPPQYVETVSAIIDEEFKLRGISPHVRVKDLQRSARLSPDEIGPSQESREVIIKQIQGGVAAATAPSRPPGGG